MRVVVARRSESSPEAYWGRGSFSSINMDQMLVARWNYQRSDSLARVMHPQFQFLRHAHLCHCHVLWKFCIVVQREDQCMFGADGFINNHETQAPDAVGDYS